MPSPLNDWSKEREDKKLGRELKREGGRARGGRKLPLFSHVSSSFFARFVYLALHAPATQFIKDGSEKLTAKIHSR